MEDPKSKLRQDLARLLNDAAPKIAKDVRSRGPPSFSIFIWGLEKGIENQLEQDLYHTVLLSKIAADNEERDLAQSVRLLVWEAYQLGEDAQPRIAQGVERFLARLDVREQKFSVMMPVEKMAPLSPPLEIEGVRIGLLVDLVTVEIYRNIQLQYSLKSPVWARFDVRVPSEALAYEAGVKIMDKVLDLLAIASLRNPVHGGDFGEVRIGRHYFLLTEGVMPKLHTGSDWWRGHPFGFDSTNLTAIRHGYRQDARPWLKLPPDSELSILFRQAYRRMGKAIRLASNPEAAIPLAISAVESVFIESESERRHHAAQRLILATIVLERGAMWPLDLLWWFEIRNAILHSPSETYWKEEQARRLFSGLTHLLDMLADLAVSRKLSTQKELISHLYAEKAVAQARESIAQRMEELRAEARQTRSDSYRSAMHRSIGMWESVRKGL